MLFSLSRACYNCQFNDVGADSISAPYYRSHIIGIPRKRQNFTCRGGLWPSDCYGGAYNRQKRAAFGCTMVIGMHIFARNGRPMAAPTEIYVMLSRTSLSICRAYSGFASQSAIRSDRRFSLSSFSISCLLSSNNLLMRFSRQTT